MPQDFDVSRFAESAQGFGDVHVSADEPDRYVVDMPDDYVAFGPDVHIADEYSDEETTLIRDKLGGDFIPVVFEFRTRRGARKVLQHILPGSAGVIDDDLGSFESVEEFLARLSERGDRWIGS
jgi:hypothetical protein